MKKLANLTQIKLLTTPYMMPRLAVTERKEVIWRVEDLLDGKV